MTDAANIGDVSTGGGSVIGLVSWTGTAWRWVGNVGEVDGSGKVGLGTSSPSQLLHLFGGNLRIEHSDTSTANIRLKNSAGNWLFQVPSSGNFEIRDAGGGQTAMSLDGSGLLTNHYSEHVVTSDVQVTNTTTETNLISPSITLNDTDGLVRVLLGGTYVHNFSIGAVRIRIKLGSTTIWDSGGQNPSGPSATVRSWNMEFTLQNKGSVSSQQLTGQFWMSTANSPTTGVGRFTFSGNADTHGGGSIGGTASETWSSALTLAVTVQFNVANAGFDWTLTGGHVVRVVP